MHDDVGDGLGNQSRVLVQEPLLDVSTLIGVTVGQNYGIMHAPHFRAARVYGFGDRIMNATLGKQTCRWQKRASETASFSEAFCQFYKGFYKVTIIDKVVT